MFFFNSYCNLCQLVQVCEEASDEIWRAVVVVIQHINLKFKNANITFNKALLYYYYIKGPHFTD